MISGGHMPPRNSQPPVVRNHVKRQTDVWAPIELHFKLCDALGLGSQFADTDTNTDSNWDWDSKREKNAIAVEE